MIHENDKIKICKEPQENNCSFHCFLFQAYFLLIFFKNNINWGRELSLNEKMLHIFTNTKTRTCPQGKQIFPTT